MTSIALDRSAQMFPVYEIKNASTDAVESLPHLRDVLLSNDIIDESGELTAKARQIPYPELPQEFIEQLKHDLRPFEKNLSQHPGKRTEIVGRYLKKIFENETYVREMFKAWGIEKHFSPHYVREFNHFFKFNGDFRVYLPVGNDEVNITYPPQDSSPLKLVSSSFSGRKYLLCDLYLPFSPSHNTAAPKSYEEDIGMQTGVDVLLYFARVRLTEEIASIHACFEYVESYLNGETIDPTAAEELFELLHEAPNLVEETMKWCEHHLVADEAFRFTFIYTLCRFLKSHASMESLNIFWFEFFQDTHFTDAVIDQIAHYSFAKLDALLTLSQYFSVVLHFPQSEKLKQFYVPVYNDVEQARKYFEAFPEESAIFHEFFPHIPANANVTLCTPTNWCAFLWKNHPDSAFDFWQETFLPISEKSALLDDIEARLSSHPGYALRMLQCAKVHDLLSFDLFLDWHAKFTQISSEHYNCICYLFEKCILSTGQIEWNKEKIAALARYVNIFADHKNVEFTERLLEYALQTGCSHEVLESCPEIPLELINNILTPRRLEKLRLSLPDSLNLFMNELVQYPGYIPQFGAHLLTFLKQDVSNVDVAGLQALLPHMENGPFATDVLRTCMQHQLKLEGPQAFAFCCNTAKKVIHDTSTKHQTILQMLNYMKRLKNDNSEPMVEVVVDFAMQMRGKDIFHQAITLLMDFPLIDHLKEKCVLLGQSITNSELARKWFAHLWGFDQNIAVQFWIDSLKICQDHTPLFVEIKERIVNYPEHALRMLQALKNQENLKIITASQVIVVISEIVDKLPRPVQEVYPEFIQYLAEIMQANFSQASFITKSRTPAQKKQQLTLESNFKVVMDQLIHSKKLELAQNLLSVGSAKCLTADSTKLFQQQIDALRFENAVDQLRSSLEQRNLAQARAQMAHCCQSASWVQDKESIPMLWNYIQLDDEVNLEVFDYLMQNLSVHLLVFETLDAELFAEKLLLRLEHAHQQSDFPLKKTAIQNLLRNLLNRWHQSPLAFKFLKYIHLLDLTLDKSEAMAAYWARGVECALADPSLEKKVVAQMVLAAKKRQLSGFPSTNESFAQSAFKLACAMRLENNSNTFKELLVFLYDLQPSSIELDFQKLYLHCFAYENKEQSNVWKLETIVALSRRTDEWTFGFYLPVLMPAMQGLLDENRFFEIFSKLEDSPLFERCASGGPYDEAQSAFLEKLMDTTQVAIFFYVQKFQENAGTDIDKKSCKFLFKFVKIFFPLHQKPHLCLSVFTLTLQSAPEQAYDAALFFYPKIPSDATFANTPDLSLRRVMLNKLLFSLYERQDGRILSFLSEHAEWFQECFANSTSSDSTNAYTYLINTCISHFDALNDQQVSALAQRQSEYKTKQASVAKVLPIQDYTKEEINKLWGSCQVRFFAGQDIFLEDPKRFRSLLDEKKIFIVDELEKEGALPECTELRLLGGFFNKALKSGSEEAIKGCYALLEEILKQPHSAPVWWSASGLINTLVAFKQTTPAALQLFQVLHLAPQKQVDLAALTDLVLPTKNGAEIMGLIFHSYFRNVEQNWVSPSRANWARTCRVILKLFEKTGPSLLTSSLIYSAEDFFKDLMNSDRAVKFEFKVIKLRDHCKQLLVQDYKDAEENNKLDQFKNNFLTPSIQFAENIVEALKLKRVSEDWRKVCVDSVITTILALYDIPSVRQSFFMLTSSLSACIVEKMSEQERYRYLTQFFLAFEEKITNDPSSVNVLYIQMQDILSCVAMLCVTAQDKTLLESRKQDMYELAKIGSRIYNHNFLANESKCLDQLAKEWLGYFPIAPVGCIQVVMQLFDARLDAFFHESSLLKQVPVKFFLIWLAWNQYKGQALGNFYLFIQSLLKQPLSTRQTEIADYFLREFKTAYSASKPAIKLDILKVILELIKQFKGVASEECIQEMYELLQAD